MAVASHLRLPIVLHLHQVLSPALLLAAEVHRQQQTHLGAQVADLVPEGSVVLAGVAGGRGTGYHGWNLE